MKRKSFVRKMTMGAMCAMMSASMLMGCSSDSNSSSASEDVTVVEESVAQETTPATEVETGDETTEATTEMGTEVPENLEDAYMGEIASIDEDTITVNLYEVPDDAGNGQGGPGGEMPTGEAPDGEMPTGEAPDGEKPTGEAPDSKAPEGNAPDQKGPQGEKPEGNAPQGERPEESDHAAFTLSGEAMVINITDTTVITSKSGDSEETITLADLAEGDVVSFAVDGEDALTIMVTPVE